MEKDNMAEGTSNIEDMEIGAYMDLCEDTEYDCSEILVDPDDSIKGRIFVRMTYENGVLKITLGKGENLTTAKQTCWSDPYVKMYLIQNNFLVDKWKSDVKKGTSNPLFEETIQYALEISTLMSHALLFTVWDWQCSGGDIFLGKVLIKLNELTVPSEKWYVLSGTIDTGGAKVTQDSRATQDLYPSQVKSYEIMEDISQNMEDNSQAMEGLTTEEKPDTDSELLVSIQQSVVTGYQLLVSLMFELTGQTNNVGKLHAHIKEARGLWYPKTNGIFVECYVFPRSLFSGKKGRTEVIKNTSCPCWNQSFIFEEQPVKEYQKKRMLDVTMWDNNDGLNYVCLGRLYLGPKLAADFSKIPWMCNALEGVHHWEAVFASPGSWVEVMHVIRTPQ